MGNIPNKIVKIMNKEKPELTNLSILLNFFLTNKNNLTREQKRDMFVKVESIREYYNKDRIEEKTVFRNGKEEIVTIIHKSLELNVEDLYPNDLYIEANRTSQFQFFPSFLQNLYLKYTQYKNVVLGIFVPDREGALP